MAEMEETVDEVLWYDSPTHDPEDVAELQRICEELRNNPVEPRVWNDRSWLELVAEEHCFDVGDDLKPHQWRRNYEIWLCGRLGLYCYNFQKGTNYDFDFVSKYYTRDDDESMAKSFITLEAVNPADKSRLTLETLVNHNDEVTCGVRLWWDTCIFRLQGSKEGDPEWDNEAINDHYKGQMPNWLSDDDQNRCYAVKNSELFDWDNWWLNLFTEIAFYTKWNDTHLQRHIPNSLPLMIQEVFVETLEEEAPTKKLKAANAIFYISFEWRKDLVTHQPAKYRAIIRKTMDGKPGHMRLEVRCWTI